MGINIHDPLVQIKGNLSLLPYNLILSLILPSSHRIRLWLCGHMHDLAPPLPPQVSLLVG